MENYAAVQHDLVKAGVPTEYAQEMTTICRNIVVLSMFPDKGPDILAKGRRLEELCKQYNIAEPKGSLSIEEGAAYAEKKLLKPGSILGVTGCPAAGKSTLLLELARHPEISVFDEFWDYDDHYESKQREVSDCVQSRGIAVVAAPILPAKIKRRVHLASPPEVRKRNLEARGRPTDRTRAQYFDAYKWVDTLLYGQQYKRATISVDTSLLRY